MFLLENVFQKMSDTFANVDLPDPTTALGFIESTTGSVAMVFEVRFSTIKLYLLVSILEKLLFK